MNTHRFKVGQTVRLIPSAITHGASDPGNSNRGSHMQVFVRNNNLDQAIRSLKKKMQREGVSVR